MCPTQRARASFGTMGDDRCTATFRWGAKVVLWCQKGCLKNVVEHLERSTYLIMCCRTPQKYRSDKAMVCPWNPSELTFFLCPVTAKPHEKVWHKGSWISRPSVSCRMEPQTPEKRQGFLPHPSHSSHKWPVLCELRASLDFQCCAFGRTWSHIFWPFFTYNLWVCNWCNRK